MHLYDLFSRWDNRGIHRLLSWITGRFSRPMTTNYHSHLNILKISHWLIDTKIIQYKNVSYITSEERHACMSLHQNNIPKTKTA